MAQLCCLFAVMTRLLLTIERAKIETVSERNNFSRVGGKVRVGAALTADVEGRACRNFSRLLTADGEGKNEDDVMCDLRDSNGTRHGQRGSQNADLP